MRITYNGTAFAKLNLYLGIHGLRPDGYHQLETVFQAVDLMDLVSISLHQKGGISLRCNKIYLPTDNRNLAYKAAEAFFQATGKQNTGLHINIKKNIPVGAGMAGGSTDAACVLRLLNGAFDNPLSPGEVAQLGLTLGADVPFCLWGGTALAGGVGEDLRQLKPMPSCSILVGKPKFSVSTKAAFALYDEQPREKGPDSGTMLQALEDGDLKGIAGNLYNALEEPVGEQYPRIGQIIQRMQGAGAMGVRMTGSGSAVFGIFETDEQAKKAVRTIRMLCRDVHIVHPLALRMPGAPEA